MRSRESRTQPVARAETPAAGAPGEPPRARRLRGWRAWAVRLGLVVLAPALVLGLLEVGLRLAGYGYPTGFFIPTDTPGRWRTNERFGWRFFPRALARNPVAATIAATIRTSGQCQAESLKNRSGRETIE